MSNDCPEVLPNHKNGLNITGIEVYHIADCCRACLRIECSLTTTDTCDEDTIKFCDKLDDCISEIQWIKEGFPSLICSSCISQLRIAYNFRKVCLETNQTLVRCMNQLHDECDIGTKLSVITKPYSTSTKYALSISEVDEHVIDKSTHNSISEPIENRAISPTSSEYIHLKHFLDNDEDLSIESNLPYLGKLDVNQHVLRIEDIRTFEIQSNKYIDGKNEANSPSIKPIKLEISPENTDLRIVPVQSGATGPDIAKPYLCTICNRTYKKRVNLRIHMRTHTGEKPYECQYCEKRFYHSSHLNEHHRRHTGEKPFPCQLCNKRFTIRSELTVHTKSHTGDKPHRCNFCDRRCLTAADLKVHIRSHTGEKPYSCYLCNKKFASLFIRKSHMKIHTGERPYSCNICDKAFTQSSHLSVHMRKHTGEKLRCKVCPETFTNGSKLTVHMRTHTGKEPFKCNLCNKMYNYASELQVHTRSHSGDKFPCNRCDKKFMTITYLHEHMRTHTGENLVACSICQRQFTRPQYLIKHLRTHTGEKPYSCSICDKKFTQSSSLKVHVRSHTGERPYVCAICDRRFATKSYLQSHARKHKFNEINIMETLAIKEDLEEKNIDILDQRIDVARLSEVRLQLSDRSTGIITYFILYSCIIHIIYPININN